MPPRELTLPFAHLNLRRNPFGELPLDERAALAVVDLAPWLERLRGGPCALQFLGEAGRGKTTHLLALRAHFPGAPYLHFPEEGPHPSIPRGPLLFLDETQRLSRRTRRRLFRSGTSLVLGTHEDHTHELRRAGLPFLCERVGSARPERLARIIARRIEAARRGPGPVPRVPPAAVAQLCARFGDDVRAVEHHLYERFQELEETGDVQV